MRDRPMLFRFDETPLRPGGWFSMRQLARGGGRRRYWLSYWVGDDGSAVWRGGVKPHPGTDRRAGQIVESLFCGERSYVAPQEGLTPSKDT